MDGEAPMTDTDSRTLWLRHRERSVAIQGRVTNACRAALDRHVAKRRLAMTR